MATAVAAAVPFDRELVHGRCTDDHELDEQHDHLDDGHDAACMRRPRSGLPGILSAR